MNPDPSGASPTPLPQLDVDQVSPGLTGFLVVFAIAAVTVALFFGLTRQLRRMRHNADNQRIGPHGPMPVRSMAATVVGDQPAPDTDGVSDAAPGGTLGATGSP